MIKYIGSKRLLLDDIASCVSSKSETFVDLFSGTSRVGHHMKKKGMSVIANDYATYAKVIADCYIVADRKKYIKDAEKLINEYNQSNKKFCGYFTETFCCDSQYFNPKNGERIDWIREDLEKRSLDPILKNIMLTSLMEAADKVDSTCGVQMAYLKRYAKRSYNDLKMKVPDMVDNLDGNTYKAFQMDSNVLVKTLDPVDVMYIDPPYNQHSYLGNYHIWESLCIWDKAEHYGKACKRVDTKIKKSDYNMKRKALSAMDSLVKNLKCETAIVSFNNEGYIPRSDMEALLSKHGDLAVEEIDYKRYVGAKIGIHNKKGKKVGKVSHLENKEYLYVLNFKGEE